MPATYNHGGNGATVQIYETNSFSRDGGPRQAFLGYAYSGGTVTATGNNVDKIYKFDPGTFKRGRRVVLGLPLSFVLANYSGMWDIHR